jgi:hypothetical protein
MKRVLSKVTVQKPRNCTHAKRWLRHAASIEELLFVISHPDSQFQDNIITSSSKASIVKGLGVKIQQWLEKMCCINRMINRLNSRFTSTPLAARYP